MPLRTMSSGFRPLGIPVPCRQPDEENLPLMVLLSPAMERMMLLLPAPLAPIRITILPRALERLTALHAWMPL